MKILQMGLAQTSIAAMATEKHLVIPCGATDSEDLFEYLDCELPDVVVVDIDTHPWVTFEINHLRRRKITIPLVGLVSKNCLERGERRADFLESGGNDLLEKPVYSRELIASLDVLYRLHSSAWLGRIISVTCGSARLSIDTLKHAISVDDINLILTPMEYRVFEILFVHKGQAVTKKTIRDSLYGLLDIPECNSTEVMLTRIRQKITKINPDAKNAIETLRGSGYRLNES